MITIILFDSKTLLYLDIVIQETRFFVNYMISKTNVLNQLVAPDSKQENNISNVKKAQRRSGVALYSRRKTIVF